MIIVIIICVYNVPSQQSKWPITKTAQYVETTSKINKVQMKRTQTKPH